MPYSIMRARVGDFPKWRRAFDDNSEAREEAGSNGGHLFRSSDDRDEVVVFLAWEDMQDARDYFTSDALDEEREAGDVKEEEVLYLEELSRPRH